MRATVSRFLVAALVLLAGSAGVERAAAQKAGEQLRVATRVIPPMVIEQDGKLTGFSIELWDAIAAKLGFSSRYIVEQNVGDLLAAVRDKRAEVGIAAISITSERDKDYDFSQPMLAAGLQILVRSDGSTAGGSPWRELLSLVFSRSMLGWIFMALLFALIPAHVIWWLERQHPQGILSSTDYVPGIFQAMWWSVGALLTQSDQMPRQWIARICALFWMFTGLVFVAYYTAQLTATLTVQQIIATIRGPDDLPGKRVATLRNSTSAQFLKQIKVTPFEVDRIDQAFAELHAKKVEAVVFDAPVLQYYASHEGKGRVMLAGTSFRKEDYGIAFPLGSTMRKRVDGALLSLREDGTYDRLHEKWFGGK